MKRFSRFFWLAVIFIFLAVIIFAHQNTYDIKAYKGVINLSKMNLDTNPKIKLKGNWDLYFDKLVLPKDINKIKSHIYFSIPGKLNEQIKGKNKGYMTLHLKILVPKDEIYGLYLDSLFTSSDVWVNGIYLGGSGKVGKTAKREEPIYKPQYLFFPSVNKKVDLVIHTSTYRDIEPSLRANDFGTQNEIMKIMYTNVAVDGIALGIMLVMGIISFGFYFTKPKQKRYAYFSAICFFMFLRALVFNSRLLVELCPGIPYEVVSKIAAITFYISITLYILFLNDIFESRIRIAKMSVAAGTFFTVLCCITDNKIYDSVSVISQGIFGVFAVYLTIFIFRELFRKNPIAGKKIIPFVAIIITTINDMLVNNSIIYGHYCAVYGAIIFVMGESLFIVENYLKDHRKLDKLNKDGLTSLYNNKYIKEILLQHIKRYNLKKEKFSLIMIDIDDFKGINDNYGHMFGDTVIIDVANILAETIEDKGYAGRFGGDEFIIVLPKFMKSQGVNLAHMIMKKMDFQNNKYDIARKITLSIGVYENNSNDLEECINNADKLLYTSKSNGKGCIN